MNIGIVQSTLIGVSMAVMIYGQTDSARIVGTVADISGAIISNAVITAKNERTGQERKVVADEHGYYVIPNLTPSSYTVTGQGSGLGPAEYTQIPLSVGQERRLNIIL